MNKMLAGNVNAIATQQMAIALLSDSAVIIYKGIDDPEVRKGDWLILGY